MLKRHFYKYERYQEVRTKEMMEARVDAVFASIVRDKDFLDLTKFADGRLPMVMSPKAADQMKMKNWCIGVLKRTRRLSDNQSIASGFSRRSRFPKVWALAKLRLKPKEKLI